jgi:hypothetical protein
MDIWTFQKDLSRMLGLWGLANVLGGLLLITGSRLLPHKNPTIEAIGFQSAGWGVVNFLIAFFGLRSSQKREANQQDRLDEKVQQQESKKLKRLLLFNVVLDVFYLLGGASLVWKDNKKSTQMSGHGLGIIIQSVYLFFFDLIHANRLG